MGQSRSNHHHHHHYPTKMKKKGRLDYEIDGTEFQNQVEYIKTKHQQEFEKRSILFHHNDHNDPSSSSSPPPPPPPPTSLTPENVPVVLPTPYSGTYKVKYIHRMKYHEATVHLVFTNVDGRYQISGTSNYHNGDTNIVEGLMLLDGRECWWREEYFHTTGRSSRSHVGGRGEGGGVELLTYGQFDLHHHTFVGNWRFNQVGQFGSLIEFRKDA